MLSPIPERVKALIYAVLGACLTTAVMTLALFIAAIIVSAFTAPSSGGASVGRVFEGVLAVTYLLLIAGGVSLISSFVAFAAGITVVGIPAWLCLHRIGVRGRKALIAAGAILSVAGGLAIMPQSAPATLLLAVPGGVAGWIIWKYGYRQPQAASEASAASACCS